MDALHVVLLVALLLALGGAIWSLFVWSFWRSRAQSGEARADAAIAERERVEALLRDRCADADRELHSARARADESDERVRDLEITLTQAQGELQRASQVHAERERALEDRERQFRELVSQHEQRAESRMREAFATLASQTLNQSSREFLRLAEQKLSAHAAASLAEIDKRRDAVDRLVAPIGQALAKTDEKLAGLEKSFAQDRATLAQELRHVGAAGEQLRTETARLVKALSRPEVRGRYGEIQLRRVAELAGMSAHCDFTEQRTLRDAEGDLQRPDMVVRLPGERVIAVDAKTNTLAYLDAHGATSDEEREAHLQRFARHVADQARKLGAKSYWASLADSPEFVVMFLPGDQFLDAALEREPRLIESAAEQGVILATPSTLIGLLRAVAVGWREKRLEEQARELLALGRELHERASVALAHAASLGSRLQQSLEAYNRFVASYASRVEPTLRKFEEVGVRGTRELPELKPIDASPRLFPTDAPPAEAP